jgi:hypothetical protein
MVFNLYQILEMIEIINKIQISGSMPSSHQMKLKVEQLLPVLPSFSSKKQPYSKPIKISKTNKQILIRKHDLNMYMSLNNSTKPRPLVKMLEDHGVGSEKKPGIFANFIDQLDLTILEHRQKIDQIYYK